MEVELGVVLPEQLRALYRECDGFREPLGNAKYLLSLQSDDRFGSLVSITKFWWHEWPQTVSNFPIDFSEFVFFGSSAADESWEMRLKAPHDIIAYHHSMENEFERRGSDILKLYRRDLSRYG